jgi:hypothetical protein
MIGELERVWQEFIDEVKKDEKNAESASKVMMAKVKSVVPPDPSGVSAFEP